MVMMMMMMMMIGIFGLLCYGRKIMVQHVQVGNSTTYLQLNDETNFRLTTVSPEKNQLYSDIE